MTKTSEQGAGDAIDPAEVGLVDLVHPEVRARYESQARSLANLIAPNQPAAYVSILVAMLRAYLSGAQR